MKLIENAITDYLEMRRATGIKLNGYKNYLNSFSNYLAQNKANHISIKLAIDWARQTNKRSINHAAKRLSIVRNFAKYYSVYDKQTQIPPAHLLKEKYQRVKPYIYHKDEINLLLETCLHVKSEGLRHLTYYTLMGLLVVTGCRIGEIIMLEASDYNADAGLLTIRNGKNHNTRIIPLHKSTVLKLNDYRYKSEYFHDVPTVNNFFVKENGSKLTVNGVETFFVRISKTIGLRNKEDNTGPRIHDFRHTFAVNTIIKWYKQGLNVDQQMPFLSTYLGHQKPSDTYWYLTAVPELVALAARRLENSEGGL